MLRRPPNITSRLNDGSDRGLPSAASILTKPKGDSLIDQVNRAKARWLKRVMYETTASSTEKCFAYVVIDHLNCVTLDSWPGQPRFVQLLGRTSIKTAQRAARGLERLGVLTITYVGGRCRYAPVFRPGDEDKSVSASGHKRCADPDKDVNESFLSISLTSSSTAGASNGSEQRTFETSSYDPRQRGSIELGLAAVLGRDGLDVLSRLAAFDDAIVDRLCRAFAENKLGERELIAARLAAEQM